MAEQAIEIGTLKDIVFSRDDFLIGKFAYEEKRGVFVALGRMLRPEPGLAYKLRGAWVDNAKFGKQLSFNHYEVLQPKDAEGIYKYLVRVAKWIGPTVAGRIVTAYGADSLDVLRKSPDRVAAEIKGITAERAREIQACLVENEAIEAVLVEIEKVLAPVSGVPKNLGFDMVSRWGANAVIRLKENPYILTRIKGVGFMTADKIAMALGYDSKAATRAAAAVIHVIEEAMAIEGHVWVGSDDLRQKVAALTGLDSAAGVEFLGNNLAIKDDCYAKIEADADETAVAQMIVKILHGQWRMKRRNGSPMDVIDEANDNMELHTKHRIEKARKQAAAVATAFPGGGPSDCEDCGEKIPEGRRQAAPGCTRCVKCQSEIEYIEKCAEPKHVTFC